MSDIVVSNLNLAYNIIFVALAILIRLGFEEKTYKDISKEEWNGVAGVIRRTFLNKNLFGDYRFSR
jgi:hypothetical protein